MVTYHSNLLDVQHKQFHGTRASHRSIQDKADDGALFRVPEEDVESGKGPEESLVPQAEGRNGTQMLRQGTVPEDSSAMPPVAREGQEDKARNDVPEERSLVTRSVMHKGFKAEYLNQLYGEPPAAVFPVVVPEGSQSLSQSLSVSGLQKLPSGAAGTPREVEGTVPGGGAATVPPADLAPTGQLASPFSKDSGQQTTVEVTAMPPHAATDPDPDLQRKLDHVDELYRAAVIVDQV